jgi:hypothetical protein
MNTLKLFYDTGLTPGKGVIREFVLGGDTADAALIAGACKALATHLKVAESSVAYLLQYGYDQSMQDSIAGRAKRLRDKANEDAAKNGSVVDAAQLDTDVESDIMGALGKRHDAIVNGTVGTRVGRSADPLAEIAREIVGAQLAAKGLKVGKGKDVTTQNFGEMVAEFLADPARRAKAQKESDRRAKFVADVTI